MLLAQAEVAVFLGATPKSAPMKATDGWYATVICPSARP